MKPNSPPSDPSWFERPRNIRIMIIALIVICAALALSDLFYTNPHPHFPIESTFGFQAWFGFVSFVVVVILGSLLRLFVSRPEDYYERQEHDHDSDR